MESTRDDAEAPGAVVADQSRTSTNTGSLQFDAPQTDSGKVLHQLAIPQNGGPFKGFAFVVVRDGEKARHAQETWSWDTKGKRTVVSEEGSEEEDHEEGDNASNAVAHILQEKVVSREPVLHEPVESPAEIALDRTRGSEEAKQAVKAASAPEQTPEDLANRSGLCIMSIGGFNSLRLEYLRYTRDITTLKEKQEAQHADTFTKRQQRRSISPSRAKNQRRSPSPDKWERKARSPSPEKWERKPLSPLRDSRPTRRYDDAHDDDYPRGCVCFVKRFHPDARSGTLKTLFQAILELEEVSPRDHLQHVDHKRNVDSVRAHLDFYVLLPFALRHMIDIFSFSAMCALQMLPPPLSSLRTFLAIPNTVMSTLSPRIRMKHSLQSGKAKLYARSKPKSLPVFQKLSIGAQYPRESRERTVGRKKNSVTRLKLQKEIVRQTMEAKPKMAQP